MVKNIYLLDFKIKGIKNIENPINIQFYEKNITKDFNSYHYNLKAIYGENGVGKSGIVTAMKILKEIIINKRYLSSPYTQINLIELINKKEKKLELEVDFVIQTEEKIMYYNYIVKLIFNELENEYVIDYEKLSGKDRLTAKSLKTIYEISNGKIISLCCDTNFSKIVDDNTRNLLLKCSLVSIFSLNYELFKNENKNSENQFFYLYITGVLLFGSNIYAFLEDSDEHNIYAMYSLKEENKNSFLNHMSHNREFYNATLNSKFILKDNIDDYEKEIESMKEFIRISKPELKNIEIEKEDKDIYICDLYFNYGDYRIHSEFESTGIKKLIKLFTAFKLIDNGAIVFIDELDSNIHDVYLCKLLEYFMEYSSGQLCFTTHNMGPMNVLKKAKKSIDFLSRDGHIIPWVTNGNNSVENLYKSGMIEKSPFNIDSTDFLGIFNKE